MSESPSNPEFETNPPDAPVAAGVAENIL
ncbi:MAG: hypothetical protein RL616_1922, partial [Verrucomicrobiota bacterium]